MAKDPPKTTLVPPTYGAWRANRYKWLEPSSTDGEETLAQVYDLHQKLDRLVRDSTPRPQKKRAKRSVDLAKEALLDLFPDGEAPAELKPMEIVRKVRGWCRDRKHPLPSTHFSLRVKS